MLAWIWGWVCGLRELFVIFIFPVIKEFFYRLKYGKEFSDDFRRKSFAQFLESIPSNTTTSCKYKLQLFQEMKGRKNLRVLEIGIGHGTCLQYYPPGTKLTALEPNRHFEAKLRKKLEQFPSIQLEQYCVARGENMHEIESGSIDAVVTAITACSVKNYDAVLKEISRVLVPGGKYYYWEHVLDHDKFSVLYFVQRFFVLSRIWPLMFDGCSFTDVYKTISKSKYFSNSTVTKCRLEGAEDSWMMYFIGPHIYGTATKG